VTKKRVKVPGGRGLISKELDSGSRLERFAMAIEGVSRSDTDLILKVVKKYRDKMAELAAKIDDSDQKRDFEETFESVAKNSTISLFICHSKFYPLRLEDMLSSKDTFSLAHDLVGIDRSIDKDKVDWSGDKLFLPRYADGKKKGAWL
jgi:hypothetical protein